MSKLAEWKDQWNNGDVKFVPELFELVENQIQIINLAYGKLNIIQSVLDEGRRELNKHESNVLYNADSL